MKYTFAIAALLSLASVEQVQATAVYKKSHGLVISEESVSDSDEENEVTMVQIQGDDSESDHSKEYFPAGMDEMLGDGIVGEYKRVTPPRFAEDTDDVFMRSMIENYALEQKTKKGFPSGNFWMNEATTKAAAFEVLETHKGMKGAELSSYLDKYFSKAWNHFDVNRTGFVEVIKMPQFMRFLSSDQYMTLQP